MHSSLHQIHHEYRSLATQLVDMPLREWASRFSTVAHDPWADGSFGMRHGASDWDLYGLVDMLICAITLEPIQPLTQEIDPQRWADRIRSCLDERGLATRRNPTDHVLEHATAYAYTGLVLLSARGAQVSLPSLRYFRSTTFSPDEFTAWFDRMGFSTPRWIRGKGLVGSMRISASRLGWYRFWSGSHTVAGVMATMIMRAQLQSPGADVPAASDMPQLAAFFRLANDRIDPSTGLWRSWIKRTLSATADAADVGGAAHFLWLYDRVGERHPNPDALLQSALRLQKPDGLLMRRPSCIDLDFTHLLWFAARTGASTDPAIIDEAMLRSGVAVLRHLLDAPTLSRYRCAHDLPGALCALAQVDGYLRWRTLESGPALTANVLSEACWI